VDQDENELQGRGLYMNSIRRTAVAAVVILFALLAGFKTAAAQLTQFQTPEVGNRRVVLRWEPVPGDTLDVLARRTCSDSCDAIVDTTITSAELDSVKAVCRQFCDRRLFGGYQIWRSAPEDTGQMVLLRTYSVYDTTWTFRGDERVFVDPDSVIVRACGDPFPDPDCNPLDGKAVAPFNGFPYYYAVTWFESQPVTINGGERITEYEMQSKAQGRLVQPVQPSAVCVTTSPLLAGVHVVPNPFNLADEFHKSSFGAENRIQFINLPCPATIRIYSVAGDLIHTLENTDSDASMDWDLRNGDGEDIVGGIYIFQVEAAGGSQTRSGHFVIIR
jgi:hypothetical protein